MIKSHSAASAVSENECATPNAEKKKMKQLTLFDFKSKSITVSDSNSSLNSSINKENEKPAGSDVIFCGDKSPSPLKKVKSSQSSNSIANIMIAEKGKSVKHSKSAEKIENSKFFENLMSKKPAQVEEAKTESRSNEPVTSIGGKSAFDDHSCLPNHFFGDTIMVLELYNLYVKLYEQIMDYESLKEQVKLSKIDYQSFIDLLTNEGDQVKNFEYFKSIVETLLRIIMSNEGNHLNELLGGEVKLERLSLQELCRIILLVDQKSAGLEAENEESDEKKRLYRQLDFIFCGVEKDTDSTDITKVLYDVELKEFSAEQKIQLISALCCKILRLEIFLECFNELRGKIADKRNEIKECKAKILDYETRKNSNNSEVLNKLDRPVAPITSEKKYEQTMASLQNLQAEKKEMSTFLASCERIEPIGTDIEQNLYWKFGSLPDIIVRESPKQDLDLMMLDVRNPTKASTNPENESLWFTYNARTNELSDLVKYLGNNYTVNLKLITELKKFIKKEKATQQIDGFLVKNKKEEEVVAEVEVEAPKNFIVRRSTRIASKQEIVKVDDDDDDFVPEVIDVKTKEEVFDKYCDMTPIDAFYNILNDVHRRLVDVFLKNDEKWSEKFNKGFGLEEPERKFNALKNLMLTVYSQVRKQFLYMKFHLSNIYLSFKDLVLESRTLSNLYLLLRVFEFNIKWWKNETSEDAGEKLRNTICKICKKKPVQDTNAKCNQSCCKWFTVCVHVLGLMRCSACKEYFHRKCVNFQHVKQQWYECDVCVEAHNIKTEEKRQLATKKELVEENVIEISNYRLRRNKQRQENVANEEEAESEEEEEEEAKKPKGRVTRNSLKTKEQLAKDRKKNQRYLATSESSAMSCSEESRDSITSQGSSVLSDVPKEDKQRAAKRKLKSSPQPTERAKSLRTRSSMQKYKETSDDE